MKASHKRQNAEEMNRSVDILGLSDNLSLPNSGETDTQRELLSPLGAHFQSCRLYTDCKRLAEN
jgi:hypothetical protein